MADTTYPFMYLARPTDAMIHDFILSQFVTLWDEYQKARSAIPQGNLVEVGYAELVRDPQGTVARIYSSLGVSGFDERMRARVEAHTRRPTVRGHKVNSLGELEPALRRRVAERWKAYSEAWGYEWK